ncbi:PspC domain-containing protein [Pedobacter sp. HMF7647]|uniref:PspC domain-containing protein n=1 Tax=Hufsiella arboris TaxID=2695275 RepID=A0A7K1Y9U5_9SPHI|nr:PspC domain-containing protein [Hufsiella arboris]MXV50828.1 PspC domain-containing protein [Hufsiella arboris]
MEKKLERNELNKMIGGVCAGLADYFEVDVTWIRIAFMVAVFAGLSGFLIYIIMWIAIPAKPSVFRPYQTDYRVYEEKAQASSFQAGQQSFYPKKQSDTGRIIAGTVLILVGLYFMTDQFDLLPYWFTFNKLWPLALIIPGIMIITNSSRKDSWDKNAQEPLKTNDTSQSQSDQL